MSGARGRFWAEVHVLLFRVLGHFWTVAVGRVEETRWQLCGFDACDDSCLGLSDLRQVMMSGSLLTVAGYFFEPRWH